MSFKKVNVFEFDQFRPEEIPVCDWCEHEIRGDVAVVTRPGYNEENEYCPHCAELLEIPEEAIEWVFL